MINIEGNVILNIVLYFSVTSGFHYYAMLFSHMVFTCVLLVLLVVVYKP